MSRVIEQTPTTTVSADDMFLVDGALGTRAIKHSDMSRIYDQEFGPKSLWGDSIPVEVRRNIFRGKNLGPVVTAAQWAAIAAGTFEDLFIGDYWEEVVSETSTRIWRIVDINYWMGTGDGNQECTTPHLVIMPDKILYTGKMNDTDIVTGGYAASVMCVNGLEQALDIVKSFFGDTHVLVHREIFTNAANANGASGYGWYGNTVSLPNEVMLFGTYSNCAPAVSGAIVSRFTLGRTQLSLMQKVPYYISLRETLWLRDVAVGNNFCCVGYQGSMGFLSPSTNTGVRPVFGIIG